MRIGTGWQGSSGITVPGGTLRDVWMCFNDKLGSDRLMAEHDSLKDFFQLK